MTELHCGFGRTDMVLVALMGTHQHLQIFFVGTALYGARSHPLPSPTCLTLTERDFGLQ